LNTYWASERFARSEESQGWPGAIPRQPGTAITQVRIQILCGEGEGSALSQSPQEYDPVPPQPAALEVLVLRGITGSADRPVALIDDRTITKGETREVKLGTNAFSMRVIEIKITCVMLGREGQPGTSELLLFENFLPLTKEK